MALINFFSIKFLFSRFSIFSLSNLVKSISLYPYNLIFLDIKSPFATDIDVLIPEKLPGPKFTITLKFSSIITFRNLKKSNISETRL